MFQRAGSLSILLIIATCCFAACAIAMTLGYQTVALIVGMLLVLAMAIGFFYATLHLSKVH